MHLFFYNLLLYIYFILAFPFYLFKFCTSEKYRVGLKQRLGFVPRRDAKGGAGILVHTVSVGEFLSALPLFSALEKELVQYPLVVSTTTLSGNRVARKQLAGDSAVVFFPLDFKWAVRRFLRRVSPRMVILLETELWPNFLSVCRKKGIPIVVLNGRLSASSFRNYTRWRGGFRYFCAAISAWGMQSEIDRQRVVSLGIDARKVTVTGSIKIDSALSRLPGEDRINRIRSDWGWRPGFRVLVGGSTHQGEEKILLDIYRELKDNFTGLKLIIAPRHPERKAALLRLLAGYQFKCVFRSAWGPQTSLADVDVVLVDTLGELLSVYSLADIVFIGKSLIKGGGQNLLDPAALGKTVVCGPLMTNFQAVTDWLLTEGGIIQVRDKEDLKRTVTKLLTVPEEGQRKGFRARELISAAGGVIERDMELVKANMT